MSSGAAATGCSRALSQVWLAVQLTPGLPAAPLPPPPQALVAWSLQRSFPGQAVSLVAEEDAVELRAPEGAGMLARITALVNDALAIEHPQVRGTCRGGLGAALAGGPACCMPACLRACCCKLGGGGACSNPAACSTPHALMHPLRPSAAAGGTAHARRGGRPD